MTPYYDHDGITIYHADAREILPTLAENSIDMIFTDPPYGHNNNDGDLIHNIEHAIPARKSKYSDAGEQARPIANDSPEETAALVQWFFAESKRLLKPEGSCCCCCGGGGGPDPQFARWSMWLDKILTFKHMVIWDKGPMDMGWHYRRSYETVLVAHKGQKCRWYDDSDKIENIIRHIPKIIPQATDHPTPKPVPLVSWFLRLHSQPGDLVLDPFMGAGSTARACKNLRRRFIGIELEERWCELAVQRLSQEVFDFT